MSNLLVGGGRLVRVGAGAGREGKELQAVGKEAVRWFMWQEQLKSVGVDVGRHELLEGFKVNCDLFEFDMILNAKGGCGGGCIIWSKQGWGKSFRGDILSHW